ncbi:hypothetical protein TNCV_3059931 [Trichonephila clavipes]|nr:hypothetical protein TNCV_3059931 [Trichonephila clavipes]
MCSFGTADQAASPRCLSSSGCCIYGGQQCTWDYKKEKMEIKIKGYGGRIRTRGPSLCASPTVGGPQHLEKKLEVARTLEKSAHPCSIYLLSYH